MEKGTVPFSGRLRAVFDAVDWRRAPAFLDKELQKVVRDAEDGRRHADKLIRVHTLEGHETWVLIHVEVQRRVGRHGRTFPVIKLRTMRVVPGLGITGPATLKYRDEETLLASVDDPEAYNREVIWPDKVRLNREYIENWSFRRDLRYIWHTVVG